MKTRTTKKIGVVGLGAIGRPICQALDHGIPGVELAGATARDAIQFPLRYADPADRELVALLTACLA